MYNIIRRAMIPKKHLLLISFCFGVLYLLFSKLAPRVRIAQIDFDLTVKLQDKFHSSFDGILETSSMFAGFEPVLILLIIVLVLNRRLISLAILPVFAFAHLIEIYGKLFINHPGPPVMFLRGEEITFFPKWYVLSESSYPSGHALRVVFIAILLSAFFLKLKFVKDFRYMAIIGLALWVILASLSRVILGQHWTSDIVGGGLLGFSLGTFALLFF